MPDTDIGSALSTNLSAITEYSVDPELTDAGSGEGEFRYQIEDWEQALGYYMTIPELRTAVDTEATWVVGGGFEADEATQIRLSMITGSGKDTFNTILFNSAVVMSLAGDSFSEIIYDNDVIINLKPLDPASMVIVYDRKGRILRYEQVTKHSKQAKHFAPNEIFHLSRNRIADQVHGTSIVSSVENIILARNEAFDDWKTVLRRNVKPMRIWYVDTDDDTQVASFKTKIDTAHKNTENLVVPKGTVETEIATVAPNQALNPVPWINNLNNNFFQAVGVPQIVVGNAAEFTDASAKIAYLAFEQTVKGKQLYIEEQVLYQLNFEINLTFPASLQQDLISSEQKESDLAASEPNDTTAEVEGNT